jgi:predicted TIM-barrel fold metal-dependent hydrolase
MRSPWDGGGSFAMFRSPTVVACHTLLMSNLHRLFPALRWGFIEASAQWVPWIVREARNRLQSRRSGDGQDVPENLLKEWRVFVTCQNDDDIPYLIQEGHLDSLVIGTDFGHFDPSSDVDAISKFRADERISAEAKEKILYHNPKAFYNL